MRTGRPPLSSPMPIMTTAFFADQQLIISRLRLFFQRASAYKGALDFSSGRLS
jgi:hypothetical protein